MSIPEAKVNSKSMSLFDFGQKLLKAAGIGVVVSALLGLTIGASKVGCENKAITYAKKMYPGASCDALDTCGCACKYEVDSAICRIGNLTVLCNYSYDSIENIGCRFEPQYRNNAQ